MTFHCSLRAAPKCTGQWGNAYTWDGRRHLDEFAPCYPCQYFTEELHRAAIDLDGALDEPRSVLRGMLKEVREAAMRAEKLHMRVERSHPKKAAASDGIQTISGFAQILGDVGFAPPEHVRTLANSIGHRLGPNRRDRRKKGGWSGRYHACHAEKQLAVLTTDTRLAISQPMCDDCRAFFRRLAQARKTTHIVKDPHHMHVFLPDGSAYELKAA
jgi:hypothetical protein